MNGTRRKYKKMFQGQNGQGHFGNKNQNVEKSVYIKSNVFMQQRKQVGIIKKIGENM